MYLKGYFGTSTKCVDCTGVHINRFHCILISFVIVNYISTGDVTVVKL